ncbi:MAG: metal ABC transporter permease [Oscillospiraceae bacterium]|jgi:zinc transport system permease protein|nr:metal ABC transporter permease [Oscillospiraceae bacterium]
MFQHEFMQNALFVSVLIGVMCPCIGIFLVIRKYSMIGDTLSHASLAGVAGALFLGQAPIAGAFVFTSLCGILIEYLRKKIKNTDLVLSVVLALCVGFAVTIMSTGKLKANASSFLFGSVLTVTRADTIGTLVLTAIAVLVIILLHDKLLYISFDEKAARVAGVKTALLGYVFIILVACAVSVAIRVVGVLVISSMISLPVATAIQLRRGFVITFVSSILFSVFDAVAGLVIAYRLDVAPSGVTALVSVATLFLVIAARALYSLKRAKK